MYFLNEILSQKFVVKKILISSIYTKTVSSVIPRYF